MTPGQLADQRGRDMHVAVGGCWQGRKMQWGALVMYARQTDQVGGARGADVAVDVCRRLWRAVVSKRGTYSTHQADCGGTVMSSTVRPY